MQTKYLYNDSVVSINVDLDESKINKVIRIILLVIAFAIPISTSLTSVLLPIFLFLWMLDGNFIAKTKHVWKYTANFAPIIIFLSLLVGCLYSVADWGGILIYLKKMSKLIYLPFLTFYFKDLKQRTYSINAIIIASVTVTIIGTMLYNFSYGNFTLNKQIIFPFKNSIDTGLITIVTTFLLMHKLHYSNKLYKNLLIGLFSLGNIFFLFHCCICRISQLIFVLLASIFILQKFKNNYNYKKILIMSPLVAIVLICGAYFSPRCSNIWATTLEQYRNFQADSNNYEENSISLRLIYYKNSLALIKQRLFFGWGTGSFPKVYREFVINNNKFIDPKYSYIFAVNPHNEYLLFGVQLGMVGICLLLWFFYILIKTSFVLINNEYEKCILQGITIIMIFGCLANSWFMDFTSGHLFVFLTAIALGALPDVCSKRNN